MRAVRHYLTAGAEYLMRVVGLMVAILLIPAGGCLLALGVAASLAGLLFLSVAAALLP